MDRFTQCRVATNLVVLQFTEMKLQCVIRQSEIK